LAEHPNRHIREAIEFALTRGWTLVKSAPRAHSWGAAFLPLCWARRMHSIGLFNAARA